jgi:MFS transporter, DHA2 family, multidrug resistance protein
MATTFPSKIETKLEEGQLSGPALAFAAITLALANFMVVLDTTIANVSVPHMAGSLGVSPSQGIWIITSYAVAEAVSVPLTGWLAGRFGAVKSFLYCMIGFTVFSVLCGMSSSFAMLVVARVGQGLFAGPIMPLSQTLLLRIFGRKKSGNAMGIWSVTTVIAPVLGPILGGIISDNYNWSWIFFINIPVAAFIIYGVVSRLSVIETTKAKLSFDTVGLALLILFVGALQLVLDLGREQDWFGSSMIVSLSIVSTIAFALFVAWEMTEKTPIVDLRVFRHRGFTAAVLAQSFGYAVFFATLVLIPQYLQTVLGYTATSAGFATAGMGVGSFIMSPIVAAMTEKMDSRRLACFGLLWLGFACVLRAFWTSGSTFWDFAIPQIVQGFGVPFFFIPLTVIALGSVEERETASAAGLMNFSRTMSGAIGSSIAASWWYDKATVARSEMTNVLNTQDATGALDGTGLSLDQVRGSVEHLVDSEAFAVAITQLFVLAAVIFAVSALIIWLAPRPTRALEPGAAH